MVCSMLIWKKALVLGAKVIMIFALFLLLFTAAATNARPSGGEEDTTFGASKAASVESKGGGYNSEPNPCTLLPIYDPNHCD